MVRELAEGMDVYEGRYVARALHLLDGKDGRAVDEAEVGVWLDQVYAGAMAEGWAQEVSRWRAEFRVACLSDLRAFQSNPELAEAFDRMFDGTEVLPRGLVAEYDRFADAEPLAAVELLVPISSRQLAHLKRLGRAGRRTDDGHIIVDASYDSERGLDLTRAEE